MDSQQVASVYTLATSLPNCDYVTGFLDALTGRKPDNQSKDYQLGYSDFQTGNVMGLARIKLEQSLMFADTDRVGMTVRVPVLLKNKLEELSQERGIFDKHFVNQMIQGFLDSKLDINTPTELDFSDKSHGEVTLFIEMVKTKRADFNLHVRNLGISKVKFVNKVTALFVEGKFNLAKGA